MCVGATPGVGVAVDMARIFMTPGWAGGGRRGYVFLTCRTSREGYEKVAGLMREGKVKTVVERVVGMEGMREGFERLKTGRVAGKVVVKVAEVEG